MQTHIKHINSSVNLEPCGQNNTTYRLKEQFFIGLAPFLSPVHLHQHQSTEETRVHSRHSLSSRHTTNTIASSMVPSVSSFTHSGRELLGISGRDFNFMGWTSHTSSNQQRQSTEGNSKQWTNQWPHLTLPSTTTGHLVEGALLSNARKVNVDLYSILSQETHL